MGSGSARRPGWASALGWHGRAGGRVPAPYAAGCVRRTPGAHTGCAHRVRTPYAARGRPGRASSCERRAFALGRAGEDGLPLRGRVIGRAADVTGGTRPASRRAPGTAAPGSRPARGRLSSLLRCIGAVGAFALVLAGLTAPGAAVAQSVSLVSSILSVGNEGQTLQDRTVAQGFTTGSQQNYEITSVVLFIGRFTDQPATTRGLEVKLMTESDGALGDEVLTFRRSEDIVLGRNEYTVASEDRQVLAANTKYFIRVRQSGGSGGNRPWAITAGNHETGLSGWSIDNNRLVQLGNTLGYPDRALRMEIKGRRVNRAATGLTITGTPRLGRTLSADTSGISDRDGLDNVRYSYQWLRVDGETETVVGSDSPTYTVVPADTARTLKVRVTFTDDAGFAEELTREVTVERTTSIPGLPHKGEAVLVGNLGQADGPNYHPFNSEVATRFRTPSDANLYRITAVELYIYKGGGTRGLKVRLRERSELFQPGREVFAVDCPSIRYGTNRCEVPADATGTLQPGRYYYITAVHSGGSGEALGWLTAASDDEDEDGLEGWSIDARRKMQIFGKRVNAAATGLVITGMARSGQTLTADTSAIADPNGLTAPRYSYQWLRVDGNTETKVGRDSATYTVARSDVGPGKRLKVAVSFLDDFGFAEALSASVSTDTSATGAPVIHGRARVGDTLTADTSAIADVDGLDNVRYRYRWLRVDGNTETRVGTDSATYTVVREDRPESIKVRVSFFDDQAFAEERTSAAVETEDTPATGAPAITGAARIGETLGVDTGGIVDPDGLDNVEYGYLWFRVDGTTETPIPGAFRSTYEVQEADLSKQLRVVVSFTDDLGGGGSLLSHPVTVRAEAAQVCPALPDFAQGHVPIWTGTVTVGELRVSGFLVAHGFSESGGSLNDTDFAVGSDSYTVEAVRVDGRGALEFNLGSPLTASGRRSLLLQVCGETYALADAQFNSQTNAYIWPATGLDWSGFVGRTRTLYLSKPDTPATGAPEISGTTRVGRTLTAATDGIADEDGLGESGFDYRWVRVDGARETQIPGASASTYTLSAADEGTRVRVEVSFTDALGFEQGPFASAAVRVRAASAPAVCTAPTLPARHDEIWLGDVTVGTVRFQGTPIAHGFAEALGPLAAAGALSDKEFETELGGAVVTAAMVSAGGSLVFGLDRALTEREAGHLVLHACVEAYPFADASYDPATHRYTWSGAALDWSAVAGRTLRVSGPSDLTPPGLVGGFVLDAGELVQMEASERLDQASVPPPSAFTVIVDDGIPVTVTGVSVVGTRTVSLSVSPYRIARGQTVIVSYTAPTSGDDASALRDEAGNDMPSFTTNVYNNSDYTGAAGRPEISGTRRVGETLTASPGDIDDSDGVSLVEEYAYQWIREDGSQRTDITGATGETYTLVAADAGKRIRVRASFIDDAGHAETRTSYATGTIAALPVPDPKITITPDRAKATGKLDFVRYTLAREGPVGNALTVTVRLDAPAGNDWGIDADDRSHEVTFGAGEREKTLELGLRPSGLDTLGFSVDATRGGTLVARLASASGYDTTDTAEIEVVVVPFPAWIARLVEPHPVFVEGETTAVEIELVAVSPDMPAPSAVSDGTELQVVAVRTLPDTAVSTPEDVRDYDPVSVMTAISRSSFAPGPDGRQRGRGRVDVAAWADSEAEGPETLFLEINRGSILPLRSVAFEGPDGRRGTSARYTATIVEANRPAGGAPGIAGSGRAGEALRATTGAISDPDGLTRAAYRYRWVLIDGSEEAEVATDSAI